MKREAYWFPPDSEDLEKPYGLVRKSATSILVAIKALEALRKYVTDFRTVGNESSKHKLVREVLYNLGELRSHQEALEDMSARGLDLKDLIQDAFHNPLKANPSGEHPMFQPTLGASTYSYDRR